MLVSKPKGGRVIRRSLVHTLAATGLIVLLGASGAGVTYALWAASTTTSSTATGSKVAVSTTFEPGLAGFEFRNHQLAATGSFTVKNTTATTRAIAMPVTAVVSAPVTGAGTSPDWASRFTVAAWPKGTDCNVATPPDATNTVSVNLVPNASGATFCLRITATDRSLLGVPSTGTFTLTPTVTTTLKFNGASEWSATSAPSITQSTKHIYPAASLSTANWFKIDASGANQCLDVQSSADQEGQPLIAFPCKSNTDSGKVNQRWRLTADGNYYRVVTQLPSGRTYAATSAQLGSGVVMQAAPGETGLWQAQQVNATSYQLVNKSSGYCLTRGATTGEITAISQQQCDALATQLFRFTADGTYSNPIAEPALNLTCTENGDSAVIISWGSAPQGGPTYRVVRNTSESLTGPGVTTLQTATTAANVGVSANNTMADGIHYILVTDGTHVKSIAVEKYSTTVWWGWKYHNIRCNS